jgi:Flp pilus assembly protein TadD
MMIAITASLNASSRLVVMRVSLESDGVDPAVARGDTPGRLGHQQRARRTLRALLGATSTLP